MPGINFKWKNPEASILEGLWARGDRRLSRLLLEAYKKGCKFDGWSDQFQYQLWQEAFCCTGVDVDFYTTRARDAEEALAWDHIDTKVTKDFLKNEWQKATKSEHTIDCRNGECNACGVCDFEFIEPKVFSACKEETGPSLSEYGHKATFFKKLMVSYSKQDQAKYFGHLELVKIFLRALRRAGIPVKFSEGFHPKPKVSFEDPLPVGLEGLNEFFYLSVPGNVKAYRIIEGLNKTLPKGLRILSCQLAPQKPAHKASTAATYLVAKKDGFFDEKELKCFVNSYEVVFTRKSRKGKNKKVDLKEMVLQIEMLTPNSLRMTLCSEPGKTIRPYEVIDKIFSLSKEEIQQAKIVKINS
jgi:radical SAM-linked protein